MSPEDGERISRSVAVDRAIQALEKGIKPEKILEIAPLFESYILTGEVRKAPAKRRATSKSTSSSSPEKDAPKKAATGRVPSADVNSVFEALKAKGWSWTKFQSLAEERYSKGPYHLSPEQFQDFKVNVLGMSEAA